MIRDELVERARAGDREALETLLIEVRERLGVVARKRMGLELRARVGVSDVVQSTCFEVVQRVGEFEGRAADFDGWMFTLLRNNVRRQARRFGAKKRGGGSPASDDLDRPAAANTPSFVAAHKEDVEILAGILDILDDDLRRLFQAHAIQGRSMADLARDDGVPETTIRSRFRRARIALMLEARRRGLFEQP
ncbi:MAG: sigma-70 family RNA polymerase sigma factor [Planctomycetota bacterium]